MTRRERVLLAWTLVGVAAGIVDGWIIGSLGSVLAAAVLL